MALVYHPVARIWNGRIFDAIRHAISVAAHTTSALGSGDTSAHYKPFPNATLGSGWNPTNEARFCPPYNIYCK
jgi:hypothetical protein